MWRKQFRDTFGLAIPVENTSYDNIDVNYTFSHFIMYEIQNMCRVAIEL